MTCPDCNGSGFLVTCCDDICRNMGECIHGDGESVCPTCHGEGSIDSCEDCEDQDCDNCGGARLSFFYEMGGPVCRVCGCDESHACVTNGVPCHWVEEDLCSACAGLNKGAIRRRLRAENKARKARVRWLHKQGHRSPRRW